MTAIVENTMGKKECHCMKLRFKQLQADLFYWISQRYFTETQKWLNEKKTDIWMSMHHKMPSCDATNKRLEIYFSFFLNRFSTDRINIALKNDYINWVAIHKLEIWPSHNVCWTRPIKDMGKMEGQRKLLWAKNEFESESTK